MNDRERLIELLDAWGVGWTLGREYTTATGWGAEDGTVRLDHGEAKITGYPYFCTVFEFDDAGAFVEVGAWE